MYALDWWVFVPFSYKKRLKNHLLGSLAMFKEVVFLISCMENDERIIMELEAGSRKPLWRRGSLWGRVAQWSSQGQEGHSGDALTFPCHRLPRCIPLEDGAKGITGLQALPHISRPQQLQSWTYAFHFRFCSPNTSMSSVSQDPHVRGLSPSLEHLNPTKLCA